MFVETEPHCLLYINQFHVTNNKRNRHKLCLIFYFSKNHCVYKYESMLFMYGVILLMELERNHFKMKTISEDVNYNKGFARISPECHEIRTYKFGQSWFNSIHVMNLFLTVHLSFWTWMVYYARALKAT